MFVLVTGNADQRIFLAVEEEASFRIDAKASNAKADLCLIFADDGFQNVKIRVFESIPKMGLF